MNPDIRQRTDQIADILEDIATLIGDYNGRASRLKDGQVVVPGLGQTSDTDALRRRVADLRQGLFTVVVMGRFKHGKSTLVNAMLGKAVMQARAIPTTAIITTLVYGQRTDVAIFENQCSKPGYLPWQDFTQRYSLSVEDADNASDQRFATVDFAQIETENPFIAQGIKLVDSPGLGEDDRRNVIAIRFLKQAQAVLFVLDALKLLGEAERSFIREEFGEGLLEHVFFVVNRVNQVEQEEIGELTARLRQVLAPHFTNPAGRFDEALFQRRVHLVDAKGALAARQRQPIDQQALDRSGLLRLEAELSGVLTSETRVRAVLASSNKALKRIAADAYHQIERQQIAIHQSLAALRQRRSRAQQALQALRQQRDALLQRLNEAAEKIYVRVEQDFHTYIAQQQSDWSQNAAQALPLESITIGDLLQCAWNEQVKAKVIDNIQTETTVYVQGLLSNWFGRLEKVVSGDMRSLRRQLRRDLRQFQQALHAAQDDFAAGRSIITVADDGAFDDLFETDFHYQASADSTGEWQSLIAKSVWALYGTLVLWVIALFSPLVLWTAIGAALMGANPFAIANKFRERIRTNIGETIFEKLKDDQQLKELIRTRLGAHFTELSRQVGDRLASSIDEADQQMQSIIDRMATKDFDPMHETQRLDQIKQVLNQRLDRLTQVTQRGHLNGQAP